MADVAYIAIVVAFVGLCVAYVRGVDRMIAAADDETAGDEG